MAGKAKPKKKAVTHRTPFRPHRWIRRWVLRTISVAFLLAVFAVILFSVFNPPQTLYMRQERARHADIRPPAGNRIQHADLAGKLQGVVESGQHRTGHQARLFGPL